MQHRAGVLLVVHRRRAVPPVLERRRDDDLVDERVADPRHLRPAAPELAGHGHVRPLGRRPRCRSCVLRVELRDRDLQGDRVDAVAGEEVLAAARVARALAERDAGRRSRRCRRRTRRRAGRRRSRAPLLCGRRPSPPARGSSGSSAGRCCSAASSRGRRSFLFRHIDQLWTVLPRKRGRPCGRKRNWYTRSGWASPVPVDVDLVLRVRREREVVRAGGRGPRPGSSSRRS